MNRWTLALCLLLVTGLALAAQKPVKPKPQAKVDPFVQMESQLWATAKAKDIKGFEKLMAEDCQIVYNTGFSTRKSETDAIKEAEINSFEILESHVTHPTPDTAFVCCKIAASDTVKGKTTSAKLYSTSVWIKTKGGWKVKLHTEVTAK